MKTVLFIRHGETKALPGRFCGATDIPLSAVGERTSQDTVSRILDSGAELVITTGLIRTDYIGTLAAVAGVRHSVEAGFREIDFGAWEGLTWKEIEVLYPEQSARWLDDPASMDFPLGETAVGFRRRLEDAWLRTLAQPEKIIAIVGHGGAFAFLRHYLGGEKLQHMDYNELIKLEIGDTSA